jgi:PKD repeat protein
VTDAGGGVSSNTSTVTVVPLPTLAISVSPSNVTDVNVPIEFAGSVSGGTTPGNASWTFGDGTSANGTVVSHAYTDSGVFFATFHYRDASGVNASRFLTVQVNPELSATLTVATNPANSAVSTGTLLQFNTSISGGTAPYTVLWAFDDGSFGSGIASQHAYAAAGTYTVTLSVVDHLGVEKNTTSRVVVGASSSSSVLGSGFDNGLLLGLLVGAAVAAVIIFATTRSKRRPPSPPTAYVPPAVMAEAPRAPKVPPWQES